MKCAILSLALLSCSLASPINNSSSVDLVRDEEYLDEIFKRGKVSMPEGRIIGGTDTTIENVPWQCSLLIRNNLVCGCSIITPTRGLTAAHCFFRQVGIAAYTVQAGSTTRVGDTNSVRRNLTRFVVHPQYSTVTISNDVGVLWFASAFPLSASIRPIPLPAQNGQVPVGATCTVSGWGLTREGVANSISNVLQVVSQTTVTNQQCNVPYRGRVLETMFCAGVPQGGRDACQGDDGGALVINGVQYGIVSWGIGCARPNIPGVYARVPAFVDWIGRNM